MQPRRSLTHDLLVGDTVEISGGAVRITLEEKSGQRARLRFEHDGGAKVERVKTPSAGANQARRGIRI